MRSCFRFDEVSLLAAAGAPAATQLAGRRRCHVGDDVQERPVPEALTA